MEDIKVEKKGNKIVKNLDYIQWAFSEECFVPEVKTYNTIPPNYYTIQWNSRAGKYGLSPKNSISDELLNLPYNEFNIIRDDISKFWTLENEYNSLNIRHKRSILIYGIHGNGKTSIITLLCNELINDHNGIIIEISDRDEIHHLKTIIKYIQEVETSRKTIITIEDIDTFIQNTEDSTLSLLLNLLDGRLSASNTVILATTNYPEKLEERLTNRPGRFNRRVEIGLPSRKVRRFYISNKIKDEKVIDLLADSTEGLNIDDIKEVITRGIVYELDFNNTIDEIKENKKQKVVKNSQNNKTVGYQKEG